MKQVALTSTTLAEEWSIGLLMGNRLDSNSYSDSSVPVDEGNGEPSYYSTLDSDGRVACITLGYQHSDRLGIELGYVNLGSTDSERTYPSDKQSSLIHQYRFRYKMSPLGEDQVAIPLNILDDREPKSAESVTITSATSAVNYTALTGGPLINAGRSSRTFDVQILDSMLIKPSENITVTLTEISVGSINAEKASGTLSISDNGAEPVGPAVEPLITSGEAAAELIPSIQLLLFDDDEPPVKRLQTQ